MERLLNVVEAGQVLNVSRQTLCRLAQRGEVAVVKIGDRTLFRPADLRRFVERHVRPAPAPRRR